MVAPLPPTERFTIWITPADGSPAKNIGSFDSIDHPQSVWAEVRGWVLGERPRPKLNDRVDIRRDDGRPFVEQGEQVADYIRQALRTEYQWWEPGK